MSYELQCQSCQIIGEIDEYIEEFSCPQCGGLMIPIEDEDNSMDVPTISISENQIEQYRNSLKKAAPVDMGFGTIASSHAAPKTNVKTDFGTTSKNIDRRRIAEARAELEIKQDALENDRRELEELRKIDEERNKLKREREELEQRLAQQKNSEMEATKAFFDPPTKSLDGSKTNVERQSRSSKKAKSSKNDRFAIIGCIIVSAIVISLALIYKFDIKIW